MNQGTGSGFPRDLLRQQVVLVCTFAILTAAAMLLPLQNVRIPPLHYLPIHTLLEFVSILAAFLVFSTVWHAPAREVSGSLLLIAMALHGAGWLDMLHALSFKGMPDLLTPASAEKAIAFWLVARLMVAVALLTVSFYPSLPPPGARSKSLMLAALLAINLLVSWAVLAHESDLPDTFVEGVGLTGFKIGFEWLITGLLGFAAWRYHRQARRSDDAFYPLIFGAAGVAALGELFLTRYEAVSDAMNLLGHLYKFVSYSLIYRAMFVISVRRPYLKLAEQTRQLIQANDTLRIQALALESTVAPVVVSDLSGKITWRNRAANALTQQLFPESADTLTLFGPPLTANPARARDIEDTVRAGGIWRGLVPIRNPRGPDMILNRTVTPLRNGDGVVEGYLAVSENVTERIAAQSRHKRVLDTALDGFWIADEQGQLLEVNEAYARMSGRSVAELLRMRIDQLEAHEQPAAVRAHLERIQRQGHDKFETRHRHKSGHAFAVEVAVTYDPESRHLFAFLRDLSERERSAAAQHDLERQLQQSQKIQALGQLTGGIAHDFNNILAAILGYSNLALTRLVPDKQSKLASYLREVITASERARDLIAKMLTFARTQPSASVGVISPSELVREVVAMMRPSIPSSIDIRSRIDDETPIRMDPGELNQVLVNLLINARDAITGPGLIDIHLHRVDVSGEICAASQQRITGPCLALDVSDSGCGIAPEHMPRLFDPFFTTKDVGKGTGLGLSMVQGILRRSGGHVLVSSTPGQGSRFRLLFPLASQPDLPAETPEDDEGAPAGAGQLVWVLDDEPAVAHYLGELLEDAGYRVRVFQDPGSALAAFQAAPDSPELLLTDQTMPGMSGMALAEAVHGQRPDLPILLCTGHSEAIDVAALAPLGIRQLFGKPVQAKVLLRAVAHTLRSPETGAGVRTNASSQTD